MLSNIIKLEGYIRLSLETNNLTYTEEGIKNINYEKEEFKKIINKISSEISVIPRILNSIEKEDDSSSNDKIEQALISFKITIKQVILEYALILNMLKHTRNQEDLISAFNIDGKFVRGLIKEINENIIVLQNKDLMIEDKVKGINLMKMNAKSSIIKLSYVTNSYKDSFKSFEEIK